MQTFVRKNVDEEFFGGTIKPLIRKSFIYTKFLKVINCGLANTNKRFNMSALSDKELVHYEKEMIPAIGKPYTAQTTCSQDKDYWKSYMHITYARTETQLLLSKNCKGQSVTTTR